MYKLSCLLRFIGKFLFVFFVPHFYTELLVLDKDGQYLYFFPEKELDALLLYDDEYDLLMKDAYYLEGVKGIRMFGYCFFEKTIGFKEVKEHWLKKTNV